MSLFGALFTGVSALSAQSQATAIVSNNIANVNTIGFKRSEASFASLVTTEGRAALYSPGTVSVNRLQSIRQQGPIQQSSSSSAISISGNGFFAVKRSGTDVLSEFLYTRNGQFSEDSQGYLRNSAGYYLYGWPLDANGDLPAAQGDLSSLTSVNVAFLGGLTRPTSSAELALNLDADQANYNNDLFSPTSNLPIPSTNAAHFSRALRVYDSLGSAQDINIQFRKTVGPMANASSGAFNFESTDLLTGLAGITAGDRFSITVNGTAVDYVIGAANGGSTRVDSIQDLIDDLNNNFGAGALVDARLTAEGRLLIQAVNPTHNIVFAETNNNPLTGANSLLMITQSGGAALTYTPEYNIVSGLPAAYPDQSNFPAFDDVLTPNTQGWWEVTVVHPDGSNISQGLINFDGNGALNAVPDSENEIDIAMEDIDWGNGSSLQSIELDISRISQFAGQYNVIFADQNGAELGLRTGIEIDREGFVVAQFSNGATAQLYKLPLITFTNPDGLNEISGTAFSETDESGEENLREAGTGGAGFIEPSTVEGSNVDLADEFAKLIIAQRAYSAGTKVINTVDQMTEDLLRLR